MRTVVTFLCTSVDVPCAAIRKYWLAKVRRERAAPSSSAKRLIFSCRRSHIQAAVPTSTTQLSSSFQMCPGGKLVARSQSDGQGAKSIQDAKCSLRTATPPTSWVLPLAGAGTSPFRRLLFATAEASYFVVQTVSQYKAPRLVVSRMAVNIFSAAC